MEFLHELLLTGVLSVLIVFLLMLFSVGNDQHHDTSAEKKPGEASSERTGLLTEEKAEEVEVERGGAVVTEEAESEDKINVQTSDQSLFDEEEWEGIERTELEKVFGKAAAYVGSVSGADALSRLTSDEQMELYGLHKVATEGPCYESQPMLFKVSARVRWHAWQRLGKIKPELAMERYMTLLSEKIPEWKAGSGGDITNHEVSYSLKSTMSGTETSETPNLCPALDNKQHSEAERQQ